MIDKLRGRWSWAVSMALALILCLTLASAAPPVLADDNPQQPQQFYGYAYINGAPAPSGTTVAAYLNGVLNASTTTAAQGRYGWSPLFYVSGTGTTVTFYVGGTLSPQTATYAAGWITNLNLYVTTGTLAVATSAASGLGTTTATLNGNLTSLGPNPSVNVYFQHGLTTSYGSTTATQSKSVGGTFNASISGLTASTTYHFRAVAVGSTTVYGDDMTFATTALPPIAVTTSAATGITSTAATLNGNLTSLGTNPSVNVYFRYGPTTSYGTTTATQSKSSTGAFSAAISGLTPGTLYHFQAVAQGSTTVYGSDTTFTTSAGTLAVSTSNATNMTATSATLNGNLTSLGTDPSVNVYFQYGLTTSYGSTTATQAKSSTGAFNAAISGLAPSTSYHFRAVAAGSTTAYGSDMTFSTVSGGGGSSSPANQFYGKVYIDGVLTSAGTTVAAYVNGVAAASTITDASGRYGWNPLFYVPGSSGTATFYVNGVLAPQTATYASGVITQLNLYTTTPSGLTITTTSLPSGTIGIAYSQTLQAVGGTTPYTWSLSSGTLPASLSLNASTGAITGTPATAGTSNFTVMVTDSATNTATKPLSITVTTTPTTLTITTASLPNGTVGTAYSQTLQAAGGTTPYTWSLSSGTLPASLSLNASTGAITGTPATAGTSNFTVMVTDSATNTATKPLSITITAAPTLTITTTSLSGGTVDTAYSQTVQASGGTTPYTWSLSSGTLPAGLSLNASTGAITGTPTTAGTSNFTVMVTDNDTNTATKPLSITIGSGNKLIGIYDPDFIAPGYSGYSANFFTLCRFQAEQTGNVVNLKLMAFRSGAVKVAIYAADSAGEPGELLGAVNTGTAVTAGTWNNISFPSAAVEAGKYYWLAFNSDTNYPVGYSATITAPARYKSASYAGFTFPEDAGTGFFGQEQQLYSPAALIAGE